MYFSALRLSAASLVLPAARSSIFCIHVDFLRAMEDGFFLIKRPLKFVLLVYTHSENAIARFPPYQTRQELTGTMGWPCLQPKAFPNSSKFRTDPLTRHRPGECGSTSAAWRAEASV